MSNTSSIGISSYELQISTLFVLNALRDKYNTNVHITKILSTSKINNLFTIVALFYIQSLNTFLSINTFRFFVNRFTPGDRGHSFEYRSVLALKWGHSGEYSSKYCPGRRSEGNCHVSAGFDSSSRFRNY